MSGQRLVFRAFGNAGRITRVRLVRDTRLDVFIDFWTCAVPAPVSKRSRVRARGHDANGQNCNGYAITKIDIDIFFLDVARTRVRIYTTGNVDEAKSFFLKEYTSIKRPTGRELWELDDFALKRIRFEFVVYSLSVCLVHVHFENTFRPTTFFVQKKYTSWTSYVFVVLHREGKKKKKKKI